MKKKTLKPRPEYMGGFSTTGEFFKMNHTEFLEYCGGRMAISIFNGSLKNELYNILEMCYARGMMRQWEITNGYE